MNLFVWILEEDHAGRTRLADGLCAGLDDLFSVELDRTARKSDVTVLDDAVMVIGACAPSDPGEIRMAQAGPYVLVVYGEMTAMTPAAAVTLCQQAGAAAMIERAAAGNGCFGAMLWDRARRELRLFSDLTASRALRFSEDDAGRLHVSSHDVGLILSGGAAPEVEQLSLKLVMHSQSSIEHGSVFRPITLGRPFDCAIITPGEQAHGHRLVWEPILEPDDCGTPLMDLVLEEFSRITPDGQIIVELSEGFDSRTALAATLAVADASRITTFCEGRPGDREVLMAERIARAAGLPFERRDTPPPDAGAFAAHWACSTVATNGYNDISTFLSRPGAESGERPVIVSGEMGEIYRGTLAPYRPFERVLGKGKFSAHDKLVSDYYETGLRQSEPETRAAIEARIATVIGRLETRSQTQQEVLDRFYCLQRFGQKNQKLMRDPWQRCRISPFYSRKAMRAAFRRPAADARTQDLFLGLLSSHLPTALDIPINGEATPSAYGPGFGNALTVDLLTLGHKIGRKLRPRLGFPTPPTLEHVRNELTAGMLQPILDARTDDLLSFGTGRLETPYELAPVRAVHGRNVWMHLAALRFIKICEGLHARRIARLSPVGST